MEPYTRVKYLRKELLQFSQKEFAERIHLSRSNLGNIETGKIRLTDRVLTDICRTFHVRRPWIDTGEEPTFERHCNPLDSEIALLYGELNDTNKKYLYGYMQRLLEEQQREATEKK